MSITDEMREWARRIFNVNTRETMLAIADRIDAEVADMQAFCDRLREAAESREDVTLFGVDYVALPLDADGEPIHVGDVMEWPYGNGEFIVEGIGGNTLFYIDKDSNECEWTAAGDKRHHYTPPTVEDVLQEMLEQAVGYSDAHTTVALNAIAEYSAKLKLAGEGE